MKKICSIIIASILLVAGLTAPVLSRAETRTEALERARVAMDKARDTVESTRAAVYAAQETYDKCLSSWIKNPAAPCEKDHLKLVEAQSKYDAAVAALRTLTNQYRQLNSLTNSPEDQSKATDIADAMGKNADTQKKTSTLDYKLPQGNCSSLTNLDLGTCIRDALTWILYIIIVAFAGLLKLAGLLLDLSMQYSVVNMKANFDKMEAIGVAWKVLRDFANMAFIFILLYVAIKTILQSDSANAKRTLVQIIIAALLINFSIFITKAVVDFSNILTLEFYNRLAPDGSLSLRFMQMFGLTQIFANPTESQIFAWTSSWQTFVAMGIGSIAVMFTATFSFLAIAFLMIYRFAIIIILIVLSPLAFAFHVLPQLQSYANRWRDALIGQAVFPVLYMLIMLVATLVLAKTTGVVNEGAFQAALTAGQTEGAKPDILEILIQFIIVIIFMNAALIVAKQYAEKVGGDASKVMNWGLGVVDNLNKRTRGVGVRVGVNAPAKMVRGGYNRVSSAITDLYKKGGAPLDGKATTKDKAAYVTSKVLRGTNKATLGLLGAVVGTADRTVNETLEKGETGRFGGDESLAERNKYYEKRGRELTDLSQQRKDERAIREGLKVDLEKLDSSNKELVDALNKLAKTTDDMSTRELEEQKKSTLMNKTFLATLSNSKFDTLMKSEKLGLTEQEKNEMKKNRTEGLKAWANNASMRSLTEAQRAEIETDRAAGKKPKSYGTFEEFIQKKKPAEIAELPTDVIETMAEHSMITGADLEQILNKGNTNVAKRSAIRSKVENNYSAVQGDIENTVDRAYDRVVTRYMAANGVSRTQAESKFKKKSQIRITADDVDPLVIDPQTRQKRAEEYERLRRSNDFLTGTKGINF